MSRNKSKTTNQKIEVISSNTNSQKIETKPPVVKLKASIASEANKYGFNYVITYKTKVSFANSEEEALNDKKKFNGIVYKNIDGEWIKC